MTSIKKIFGHFKTVAKHKYYVCIECFKVGLLWQGITHDLSKFSLAEFPMSAKFYQGNRSPICMEREIYGYSKVWVNHKAKNKHHFQYWLDIRENSGECIPVEMPYRYALELACDCIGAAKVYMGVPLDRSEPLRYWKEGINKKLIHPKTAVLLESFFENYAQTGKLVKKG